MHQCCTRLELSRGCGSVPLQQSAESLAENQSEVKIAKNIGEMTFGGGFCKCCQPQIHWYDICINVGEMCFIPMNVSNELFNGVRQLIWQHLSPVVSTFSSSNDLS